jgi:hypothetical protein
VKNNLFYYFSHMKRLLLISLVLFSYFISNANSFYFAWNGFGMASRYNYDLGMSYGAYYYRGVAKGLGLGTLEFYQNINTYYSRETRSTVGSSLRTDLTYRFFSPMIVLQTGYTGQSQIYFTGGVGELQSGGEATFSKWSRVPWSASGEVYDNTIDLTEKLNKYVFRLGFGLTQFTKLGGNFHMFVNEDVGFLIQPLADMSGREFADVKTNVAQYFQPTYISIRIGIGLITHSKHMRHPWQIYAGKAPE